MDDARGTWDLTGHIVNDTWIVEHFRVAPSLGKLTTDIEDTLDDNKNFSKY